MERNAVTQAEYWCGIKILCELFVQTHQKLLKCSSSIFRCSHSDSQNCFCIIITEVWLQKQKCFQKNNWHCAEVTSSLRLQQKFNKFSRITSYKCVIVWFVINKRRSLYYVDYDVTFVQPPILCMNINLNALKPS